MRRVLKNNDSEVIKTNLNYIEGNSNNNLKISKILYKEQKGFCVYTEEYKCSKCNIETRHNCKERFLNNGFAKLGETIYTLNALDRLSRIAQYANAETILLVAAVDKEKLSELIKLETIAPSDITVSTHFEE